MSERHEVLLLDLGNVVFQLDESNILPWMLERLDQPPTLELRDAFLDLEDRFERGQMTTPDFIESLRRDFLLRTTDEEFSEAWCQCWEADMPGLEELLEELPPELRVAALSNTNPIHIDYFLPRKPVLGRLRPLLTSYALGARKPEPEIYKRALVRLGGVAPERVLFFDDREENVEGARAVGIEAHLFEDFDQVRGLLRV